MCVTGDNFAFLQFTPHIYCLYLSKSNNENMDFVLLCVLLCVCVCVFLFRVFLCC